MRREVVWTIVAAYLLSLVMRSVDLAVVATVVATTIRVTRPTPAPPVVAPPEEWTFTRPTDGKAVPDRYARRGTRAVEPLHARQAFVKYWARDADAFARKDRFCVRVGGKQRV